MRLKQGLRFPGIEHIKSKILVYPFDSKSYLKYLGFGRGGVNLMKKKEGEVGLPPLALHMTVLA